MATRHDLKHSILHVLHHNKDGSISTQACRRKRLLQIANQLVDDGYQLRHVRYLKIKHIKHLVDSWLRQGLSPGTIKNRMADLRWLSHKLGKYDLVSKENAGLNIPQRNFANNADKSIVLTEGDLSKITNDDVKFSLLLQKAFGLRREESIKIRIRQAVVGDELQLRGSWCKNGRERTIPIRNQAQKDIIQRCQIHIGKSNRALIPRDKTYVQQLSIYERQLRQAGIHKAHGLRHAYAQQRYLELTGWECPAKGGPLRKELNEHQKEIDAEARHVLSLEIGHNRIDVVRIYVGA